MTVLRALLAALVAATGLVLAGPTPAFACDCATGEAEGFVSGADVVVVGEVVRVTPPPEGEVTTSLDPVTYTVDVARLMKGRSGETLEVTSSRFGASCGLEGIEVGGEYVVLASHHDIEGEPTRELWANLCGGTGPASPAYVAEVQAVTGPGSPPRRDDPEPAAVPAASGPGDRSGDEARSVGRGGPVWAWGGALTAGVAVGLLVLRARRSDPSGQ